MTWRRSRAAVAKPPDGNTKLPRLIGRIRRDVGAQEHQNTDQEDIEHLVVAFEWGDITVSSQPGQGARFILSLPLAAEPTAGKS